MMRKVLGTKDAILIYVSNHEQVLITLLPADVFDFIGKPISEEKFFSSFSRAIDKLNGRAALLAFNGGRSFQHIEYGKTLYIMSDGHYVKLITVHEIISVKGKLEEFIKQMDRRHTNFIRIHKSFIVNFDFVISVSSDKVQVKNGDFIGSLLPAYGGLNVWVVFFTLTRTLFNLTIFS